MSQALFEHAAKGAHEARSAGTTPGDRVHPHVLEVMAELGIDLSDRRPQLLTRELAQWADVVVTMGCGDQCPVIPGKRYLDWELPDPAGKPIDEVRRTRDEISRRVDDLLIRIQTTAKPEERVWESPETARARVESSRSAAVDGSSAGARA